MSGRFVIQRLDGYTDGKPSWLRYGLSWMTKEAALLKVEELQRDKPNAKFRIRKKRLPRKAIASRFLALREMP